MEDESILSNQTQFDDEVALYAKPLTYVSSIPVETQPSKKKKNPLFLAIIGAALIAVVSMVAVLSTAKKPLPVAKTQKVSTQQSATTQENLGLYEQRLKDLEQNFRAADPSQATLPFPPLATSITLQSGNVRQR